MLEKLVSTDFNHNPASAIVDLTLTNVIGKAGKISAWYDNEWGFSNRMIDIAEFIQKILMKNINDQINLSGKIVLLRLDLNVPLQNNKVLDETRIDKIIPVINFLLNNNAKILVLSHVGRPKGKKSDALSLKPIFKFREKINKKIKLVTTDLNKLTKDNFIFR